MNCYNHETISAVGACKHCLKGLCKTCAQDCGYGLCCSDQCKSELLSFRDMMEKSKIIYGQKGRRFPVMTIMSLGLGIAINYGNSIYSDWDLILDQ
jgi:hypothetical protein